MVRIKEVRETKMATSIVRLYFETEEPAFKRTEHFHKETFFNKNQSLAIHMGQKAADLITKIMKMKNVVEITVFDSDKRAVNYNTQRLVVDIKTTDAQKRTVAHIKSSVKKLLEEMPIEKAVIKIAR